MKPENFISKINNSLKTGHVDDELLSHEVRFFRSKYILKMIENFSKILNTFQFKDTIIFQENEPYINLNGIKLKLNTTLYLKHSGNKFSTQSLNSINFIKYLRINPKIIIDIGACWGEYSLFFAKEFPKSKIFSIEGSPLNFDTLKDNVKNNETFRENIKIFNYIITNFDGVENISNNLNTMNTIEGVISSQKQFVKVKSKKLISFLLDEKITKIDFIKIDIEGSELKLLNDLKTVNFKLLQIELINYNDIRDNLNFVKEMSKFCIFYHSDSFKELSLLELQCLIKKTLLKKPTIDIFCLNKNQIKYEK